MGLGLAGTAEPRELVRLIQEGEADAERALVERYSRGVIFLLRQLTRDPSRADDLHQETFHLVLLKVRQGDLREPDKLNAFVHQVARNLFIAEVRKDARRRPADVDAAAVLPDPAPGPLRLLLDKEDVGAVRRVLADLRPERDRELLLRFFVAEHSKEEICADLGLSSLHFNRVLHRARGRLKDLLTRYHKRRNLPAAREGAA